jgi:flagellar biosynthetic protein FlhB
MAESDSGQERTEQPTPKRLKEARDKGQVARSRELNTTVMLLFAALGLMFMGKEIINDLLELFQHDLRLDRDQLFDKNAMLNLFGENVLMALKAIAPFLLLTLITVFIGPLAMGGWLFSGQALAPKFSKLNPFAGLKRMFGPNGLIELLKALAKFVLLGSVAITMFSVYKNEFLGLGLEPLRQGMAHGSSLILWHFMALSAALILVAGIDVPYQLWSNNKKLKMTFKEVQDEQKETNGNPEVKGKIRSIQREMAQQRMLQDVPEAEVIIVNPTHYAIALRYAEGKESAPRIIAKGMDLVSFRIREVATAHDVPIFTAPPLARALYYSTEIGQKIPTGLYLAVAKVLAYVLQLKQMNTQSGMVLEEPTDLEIPEEFQDLEQKNHRFER